ncbi:MAG TPA: epoxyqueuosine reductase QueH, partial [Sulfurovum sp.]|nr:epoxyqueuosine reductase QueH [Sulfurovum sp.]
YLRLLDVKRSCKMLNIDLIEGEYDVDKWLSLVKGFEDEPEKGERCGICFDRRFEVSAEKAKELGEASYTSTLLTSPKKSLDQLQVAGDALAKTFGITFVAPDYRKASGTQEQNIMAKEDALYRQDYCGCMFALNIQRDQQEKIADELFVPLSQQVQPESIEERIEMYEKRWKMEEDAIPHKIVKQRFLNWRLSSGLLRVRNVVVPAHFLPYSTLRGSYSRGKIEYTVNDVHHMSRDEVRFITLSHYNDLAHTSYATVIQLIYAPPTFEVELALRAKLGITPYDLSVILVVDEIPSKKIEILCESKTYTDVKEVLVNI